MTQGLEIKNAAAAALSDSLRYEKDTQAFATQLNQTDAGEQLAVLKDIAEAQQLGTDKKLGEAAANFLEKVRMLSERAASALPAETETALAERAGVCDPALFPYVVAQIASPQKRDEALLAATNALLPNDDYAKRNITTLLENHPPSDEVLLKALENCAYGSIPQLEALTEYVREKNPDLFHRHAEVGESLIAQIIPDRRLTPEYRSDEIELLMDAGAKPPATVRDIDILSLMEQESLSLAAIRQAEMALDTFEPGRWVHRHRSSEDPLARPQSQTAPAAGKKPAARPIER